jgi:hypothetical protein
MASEAAVLTYYSKCRDEITRYRNLEWQITGYLTVVLTFVFGLITEGNAVSEASDGLVRGFWTAMLLAISGFGIFALSYVHVALNRRRDEAVRLELWLGLYATTQPDQRVADSLLFTYAETTSVIPRSPRRYRGFVEGKGVLFILSFIAFVAALCTVCVLQIWAT